MKYKNPLFLFVLLVVLGCNRNPEGFQMSANYQLANSQGGLVSPGTSQNEIKRFAFVTSYQENAVAVMSYTVRKTPNVQQRMMNNQMQLQDSFKMLDNSMVNISSNRLNKYDFPVGKNPVDIAISPDKQILVTANFTENSLSVVALAPLTALITQPAVPAAATNQKSAAPAPQPQLAAVKVETAAGPSKLVFSPDGKYLLCANKTARSLSVFKNEQGALKLLKNVDIQVSPNDIDIFRTANLVIISSFIDRGFVVVNYSDLINEKGSLVKPSYIEMFGSMSALAVSYATNNILAANMNAIALFPDGLESLIRNSSQLPIPSEGKNSDVMFSNNGDVAVGTNETMNRAVVIRFNQQTPVGSGIVNKNIANINFNVIGQINTGFSPTRVFVEADGSYAITVNSGSNNVSFIGISYSMSQNLGDYMVKMIPSAIAVF